MKITTKQLERYIKVINEFRITFSKFSSADFNEYVRSEKLPYAAKLHWKFKQHGLIIQLSKGHYEWQIEPIHIKKLELIFEEIKEDTFDYNQKYAMRQKSNTPVIEKSIVDYKELKSHLEYFGYKVEGNGNTLTDKSLVEIAKILGFRIFKEVTEFKEI